jgi:hypothetical protein
MRSRCGESERDHSHVLKARGHLDLPTETNPRPAFLSSKKITFRPRRVRCAFSLGAHRRAARGGRLAQQQRTIVKLSSPTPSESTLYLFDELHDETTCST